MLLLKIQGIRKKVKKKNPKHKKSKTPYDMHNFGSYLSIHVPTHVKTCVHLHK